jgi:hypothetical protein
VILTNSDDTNGEAITTDISAENAYSLLSQSYPNSTTSKHSIIIEYGSWGKILFAAESTVSNTMYTAVLETTTPPTGCCINYQLQAIGAGFIESMARQRGYGEIVLADTVLSFSSVYENIRPMANNVSHVSDNHLFDDYGPGLIEHYVLAERQLDFHVHNGKFRLATAPLVIKDYIDLLVHCPM